MRFLIRSADFKDRGDLLELASYFPLCNLPPDKSKLENKIQISQESFAHKLPKENRNYIFVLEDRQKKKLIGSCQILSYFGPNKSLFYRRQKTKSYLQLASPPKGKHQIGGLILDPRYRKSKERLGLQISFARFLYIKNFPKEFSKLIEVSLTSNIQKGKNPFWEETGQKFLKKSHSAILKDFQKNRAKFLALFPKNLKIPLDSLSLQAKNGLTDIHPQTLPVYKGLLKMGFHKTQHHHILDGGIYLEAPWRELTFLKKTKKLFLKKAPSLKKPLSYLIAQAGEKDFICTLIQGKIAGENLLVKTDLKDFNKEKKLLALKFS